VRRFLYKLLYPLLTKFYFPRVKRSVTAVACAIEHEGKFLLIRETYGGGKWTFPGGRIQKRESPEDAARREIKEELGIVAAGLRDIGEHYAVTASGEREGVVRCFYAGIMNSELRINRSEIKEAGWFVLDALPEPQSPAVLKIMKLIRSFKNISG